MGSDQMKALSRIVILLSLSLCFAATRANADGITYNLTTSDGNNLQFTIQNNSKANGYIAGTLANFYNIAGTFDGQRVLFSCIGFYDAFYPGSNPFLQDGIAVNIGTALSPYIMFFGTGNNPVFGGTANSVQLFSLPDESVTSRSSPPYSYAAYRASTQVPEPGLLSLLSLGALLLLGFRRKFAA
jgi:hypothetical protein